MLTIACSLALLLNTPLPREVHDRDEERLCGIWQADQGVPTRFHFRPGHSFSVFIPPIRLFGPGPAPDELQELKGRFTLHVHAEPGTIDLTFIDSGLPPMKGIYRFDGDVLEMFFVNDGEARPRQFPKDAARGTLFRFTRAQQSR